MSRLTGFGEALLHPNRVVPEGLSGPKGRKANNRFSVYRNNVIVALSDALAASFPVVAKLLGPTNFRNIAGVYVRQEPPDSPLMMYYGAGFADFLETFPPVQHLQYLPDVARLEHARRLSYHAADVQPVAADAIAIIPPDKLTDIRLKFAPAVHLICSAWPIYDIWRYNQTTSAPKPQAGPQNVLITRPAYDPQLILVTQDEAAFLQNLLKHETLGTANEAATTLDPAFDLAHVLTTLLSGAALIEIKD